MDGRTGRGPRTAVVVGAGVVGLSTAWFLQERGVEVTVVDRTGVAAGASWGNAGWLSPGLAVPLNEPAVLRYGLRTVLDPRAPLHVPPRVDPALWRFLLRFAAHCTWRSWARAALANLPLNLDCLGAFDALADGGVLVPTIEAPITAGFEATSDATALVRELHRLERVGQAVSFECLTGSALRDAMPQASDRLGAAVRLAGQRYVDPGAFVHALAESVRARGGVLRTGFDAVALRRHRNATTVVSASWDTVSGNAVVLATGAWLGRFTRRFGVRVPVRAGRGYSFTVPTERPVPGPLYLPGVRVACTPYRDGVRVAGTMEFRGPDDPPDADRVTAIVESARPLLTGVCWEKRTDEWVGPRPVTTDGRPLVGAVAEPGVYVAGGHGMWGLTQGPVTGRLLAEEIATGVRPGELRACDPLR
ncbi:NAD(P)/FAD-dependent oxidoreductase [Prauserella oleivorans]|uniref:NAD(P)/FAD-dependent oxidoreductase n=1 Tax=Prauserella oleivorans TaxID=1478153 RepID=A0ABW5W9A1_9PSEU